LCVNVTLFQATALSYVGLYYIFGQNAKSESDRKSEDMEFQVLESSQEMSSLKQQLEMSQANIIELESKLSSLEEKHAAHSTEASRGNEQQLERIKKLENEINSRNKKCKELDTHLQNSVSVNIIGLHIKQLGVSNGFSETFRDGETLV